MGDNIDRVRRDLDIVRELISPKWRTEREEICVSAWLSLNIAFAGLFLLAWLLVPPGLALFGGSIFVLGGWIGVTFVFAIHYLDNRKRMFVAAPVLVALAVLLLAYSELLPIMSWNFVFSVLLIIVGYSVLRLTTTFQRRWYIWALTLPFMILALASPFISQSVSVIILCVLFSVCGLGLTLAHIFELRKIEAMHVTD